MKKLYTLSLILLGFVAASAQTIFTENFGTPAQTGTQWPGVAAYTGYQATNVTYSGTATARNNVNSTGYVGASGAGNVFFGDLQTFVISGINTSSYNAANLTLTFGQYQDGAPSGSTSEAFQLAYSTNGADFTVIPYTRVATGGGWELITVSGGAIPSSATLSLSFTRSSTRQFRLDDVKLANLSAGCTVALGAATTACNASTFDIDTYNATVPFTGGGNAQLVVTSTAGTVGGDNPASVVDGNIVISGVSEGANFSVTVSNGSDCVQTLEVVGVYCKPVNTLPFYENFDYTAGTSLGNSQKWWNANSGDDILVTEGNLSYNGLAASQGRSVAFAGAGKEVYSQFTTQTEGTVYTSFIFNVTDLAGMTATDPQSYVFGWLGENSNSTYRGRIFVKKSEDQYLIGLDAASTTSNYTANAYNANTPVFVVASYDFASATFKTWINPSIADLTAATAPTLSATLTTPATNVGGFILRQDSDTTTPAIAFDELRIGTTLASVIPTVAGVSQNEISGLKVFPNPLNGNVLNITSTANGVKAVAIYDVLGKQVFEGNTVNSTVNVNLTTGIYIVKITEGGKTATRKLAVK